MKRYILLSSKTFLSHFIKYSLLLYCFIPCTYGIAKFEITSISTSSIVIRMISAANVSRFEMLVVIYDLDNFSQFRRTELSISKHDNQLFTFDGLLPDTWFAIRIEYSLAYITLNDKFSNVQTKQELIAKTKKDSTISPMHIDDQILFVEDIVTNSHSINVTVSSIFKASHKLTTLIVPELKCNDGIVLKPPAQRVDRISQIVFDTRKLPSSINGQPKCSMLCIFPFIRVGIADVGEQSFRGREWCGLLQQQSLHRRSNHGNTCPPISIHILILAFFLFLR